MAGFAATGPVVIGAVTEPPVDVLTVARRRRAAAARSLSLRSIAARLARVATVVFATAVFEAVDATVVFEAADVTVERAGDATFATVFVADATALDTGCVGADTVGTAT